MSNLFYLMPTASFKDANGNQFTAPKYSQSLFSDFAAIPYGAEPMTLVSLASANSQLAAEPDVFAFPSDLTTLLQPADVTALDNFCAPVNIPRAFAIAGMSWQEVLIQISQIFLLAQWLYGQTGSSIFADGATLLTQYGSTLSATSVSTTTVSTETTSSQPAQPQTSPLFDLSGVQSTDTIADVLVSVLASSLLPELISMEQQYESLLNPARSRQFSTRQREPVEVATVVSRFPWPPRPPNRE